VEGLLNQYPKRQYWIIDQATKNAAVILKETLAEFHIQGEITGIRKGPVITMFEILPGPGVKISKIVNLQDNIALRLGAVSVRILAPIPGKHAVGIEIPNSKRYMVSFAEIIEEKLHRGLALEDNPRELPVILGKDIAGEAQVMDLVQMLHLLIAGAAGSGKSVFIHGLILSILYQQSPGECRFIMIDPKIKELKCYNDIPHLLTPVIMEPKRAFQALQYCVFEMERRYACLDSLGVRDIRSYNKRIKERGIGVERLPYIVVVIDEFADIMAAAGKEFESTLASLAAMSRAVGIHLVLATQRLSIEVITGLIKANIPSHIAFMVANKMESRIIMDMAGAEKLLGKGDLLYAGAAAPFPVRMQGAFISEEEVERVVEYIKTLGDPDYIDDELF
jgi:S-DNA-T family DNA segregation ATPase FtsK/SpoIIIE